MLMVYFTIYSKKLYENIDNTHIWILENFFFPNNTNFKTNSISMKIHQEVEF